MACNYCSKVEGLPKVDHVLNVGGKQVYQCPMCTEYIVEIRAKAPVKASSQPHNYLTGMGYAGGFVPVAVPGTPGAFGIKAPKAKSATVVKEAKDKGSGNKLIYVGYDPAGIHKMIGDYREDYMIDPAQWSIAPIRAARIGKELREILKRLKNDNR